MKKQQIHTNWGPTDPTSNPLTTVSRQLKMYEKTFYTTMVMQASFFVIEKITKNSRDLEFVTKMENIAPFYIHCTVSRKSCQIPLIYLP